MSAHERTPLAIVVCLALVVAAFGLFIANFEWPTSRIVRNGHSISEREILLYDVLPVIVAGHGIGLIAIAITRFLFPKSDIKTIVCVISACAALAGLPLLALSAAISGTPTIRDIGGIAMIFAVPLAVATWAIVSSRRSTRDVR